MIEWMQKLLNYLKLFGYTDGPLAHVIAPVQDGSSMNLAASWNVERNFFDRFDHGKY